MTLHLPALITAACVMSCVAEAPIGRVLRLPPRRGGGKLALESLHYLATQHTRLARASLQQLEQRGSTAEGIPRAFPWACGSINVTSVLFELLVGQPRYASLTGSTPATSAHDETRLARRFLDAVGNAPGPGDSSTPGGSGEPQGSSAPDGVGASLVPFHELHSVGFLLLCRYFLETPHATYFTFNAVLASLRERLEGQLLAGRLPVTVAALTAPEQDVARSGQPRTLCEGFLHKMARSGAGELRAALGHRTGRWFVLTELELAYYVDASLAARKGAVPLDGVALSLKHNAIKHAMRLTAGGESVHLFASGRFTYEIWMAHLQELVQRRSGQGAVGEWSAQDQQEEAARILQRAVRQSTLRALPPPTVASKEAVDPQPPVS